eukprot:jgi/Botrbrau1/9662/Bobra.0131s0033.1
MRPPTAVPPGDHLLGMMQLLVMVCVDPRGGEALVKIRGGCALLLSLANKAERTQRRAGLKALTALARSTPAAREPLRDLGALQLFARVFLDDDFMSEAERPDPAPCDPPNPNSWWAAHGLFVLVGLPPTRSRERFGTPNRSKADKRFLTANLATVSKTGALSRILGVAVDPSQPAQAYAAAACGFLAEARASCAEFEALPGVRKLVAAFAATQAVDACAGLLNIMYGLVECIGPQMLDDGLMQYITAWLRRKDLKSCHIISACNLLNQVFFDDRSALLAEEAGLEVALRQHTSEYNHTDAAMAAKLCLTCLEMKRSLGGLQDGVTCVHVVKQLVKVTWDGPLDGTGPRNVVSYDPVTDEELQENPAYRGAWEYLKDQPVEMHPAPLTTHLPHSNPPRPSSKSAESAEGAPQTDWAEWLLDSPSRSMQDATAATSQLDPHGTVSVGDDAEGDADEAACRWRSSHVLPVGATCHSDGPDVPVETGAFASYCYARGAHPGMAFGMSDFFEIDVRLPEAAPRSGEEAVQEDCSESEKLADQPAPGDTSNSPPNGTPKTDNADGGTAKVRKRKKVCGMCGRKASRESPLRKCGGCLAIAYCSSECQRSHWATHRCECCAHGSGAKRK